MAGQQLKDLIRAYRRRDDALFHAAVDGIVEEELAKKHTALAGDLRRLAGTRLDGPTRLVEMPLSGESREPLGRMTDPTRTLDQQKLTPDTTAKIRRILLEAAHTDKLAAAGVPTRNRIIFSGPPGCGKTSTAAAIAAELGRPFVVARVEALLGSRLGETGQNFAKLFDWAKTGEYVLLIDEFDSVGGTRDGTDIGEMRRVTNTILQLIENHTSPTLIIVATNHVGDLDSALWRRFDVVVEMQLPLPATVAEILNARLPEVDTADLVHSFDGLPHAAVDYFANAAIREAVLSGREAPSVADLACALTETIERPWS